MTDRCKHVRGTQDKATRALARVRATIAFLWIMTAGPGTRVWYRNQTTGLRSGTSPAIDIERESPDTEARALDSRTLLVGNRKLGQRTAQKH
jgi:hypothetical protein